MRTPLPWWVKLEAFFHLSSGAVYLPAVVLSLLLFPTWSMATGLLQSDKVLTGIVVMSFFGLLTCSAGTFYMVSQQAIGRSGWRTFLMIPILMALGMGISLINTMAVLEGLFGGKDSEFVRTPKYGTAGEGKNSKEWRRRAGVFRKKADFLPFVEIACGLYMAACIVASLVTWKYGPVIPYIKDPAPGTIPFLFIFMCGYLYVGIATLHNRWISCRAKPPTMIKPLAAPAPVAA
jgi:hypothetical protein